jgi:acyl-homoserine-lactone acylase
MPVSKSLVRAVILLAVACPFAAACASAPPPSPPPPTPEDVSFDPSTEILWDRWGVPHIFAENTTGLLRAFGWAQTRAHGDRLLHLYGEARGRAAEYWGADYIESDRWIRTNGVPARAREWLQLQPPEMRSLLDAFASGINAYAETFPDSLSESARRVLPVDAGDVLAHVQRVVWFEFITSPASVQAATRAWRGGQDPAPPEPAGASNAWAIAGTRSASGRPMLLANPHVPWGGLYTWFEAQLTGPGIDAYGAALVGFPLLGIGFNDRLGWTHTVNPLDAADLYELTLTDGGYRWDGGIRTLETREETLLVRQPDGSLREQPFTIRSSLHGPVVAENDAGNALALRVAGLDAAQLPLQNWRMLRARTLEEFEAALGMLQLPFFNVVYADADGHILYVYNGRVPVRPSGDWRAWTGIQRGDTSALLWTATHDYAELPRVQDPLSGWLQNANDPPWSTTQPLAVSPAAYPAYMAPQVPLSFRAQRSSRMLNEDGSVTFDELIAYKHSTHVETADHLLDDVIIAARASSGALTRRAADVLDDWDRATDAGSRGAILFEAFWRHLRQRAGPQPFEVPWTAEAPLSTPDGIADPNAAVEALMAAASEVESRYGRLDVAWGAVHRLQAPGYDLPGNGSDAFGAFRVTGWRTGPDGMRSAVSGDSWVAAIEFGDPVRAMAALSYGNASQPGSPFIGDQLLLYASQRLRPVWRERSQIERNLFAREYF